ncbi:MAG: GNAT family N-acetyltransferase [Armatimonadetes bacterium]|nr:GNAT family N-acetyltransferase [Armatimonadota bacterium]
MNSIPTTIGNFIEKEGRNDTTFLELQIQGRQVSHLDIVFHTMRFGAAQVRCATLSDVATEKEYRNQGYAAHLIEHSKNVMRRKGAALSIVDGIRNFYHRFGYGFVQPTSFISVYHNPDEKTLLPQGWVFRPFAQHDLAAVQQLYNDNILNCSGAVMRTGSGVVWTQLAAVSEEDIGKSCRVLLNSTGEVVAYAWRGMEFWKPRHIQGEGTDFFLIAEAFASDGQAANALIAACREWARGTLTAEADDFLHVVYYVPPQSRMAHAAKFHTSRFWKNFHPSGGFRALVLDTQQLFISLQPELDRRIRSTRLPQPWRVVFKTDAGTSILECSNRGVTLCEEELSGENDVAIHLSQQTLAQMVFGSFSAADLYLQSEPKAEAELLALLDTLFPHNEPYTFPVDIV